MNNDFDKIEQLENVKSDQAFNNKQDNIQKEEKKVKKGLPIWFVIASMVLLALIIGAFLIVGETVAKEKGYGSGSDIVNSGFEDDKESTNLDHTISINGYEFELGVKLDEFLTNTGTIIDDKNLEAAKANGDLYGEIPASIIKNGEVTKFKLFVDASNKENVTIQSIKIESDGAFIGDELDLNLVAIDFRVLGKYDVNKTLFSDLDLETQKLAKKTTIKDRQAYELVLKDSTGFEIKITFVSDSKSEEKYCIYSVIVMNVTKIVNK